MDRQEKILLLQKILEDIRGNWGYDLGERATKALQLAKELELPIFINSINKFMKYCLEGENDGRFFRTHYENGGYEKMEEMHNLEPDTLLDKSIEFQKEALSILTYPENRFEDYEDSEKNSL